MSVDIMGMVWASDVRPVSRKTVLLALADNADDEGLCWPGSDYLADKCSLSRSAVIEQRKALEAEGLIECIGRRSGRYQGTNFYRIVLPALAARRRPDQHRGRPQSEAAAAFAALDAACTAAEDPAPGQRPDPGPSPQPPPQRPDPGPHSVRMPDSQRPDPGPIQRPDPGPKPSWEPPGEPPVEPSRARGRAAPVTPGRGQDPAAVAYTARRLRQTQRERRGHRALAETAVPAAAHVLVSKVVAEWPVPPKGPMLAEWRMSVADLWCQDVPESAIRAGMEACRAKGYGPKALTSFVYGEANKQTTHSRADTMMAAANALHTPDGGPGLMEMLGGTTVDTLGAHHRRAIGGPRAE